ncbi:hypothetical protein GCM10010524_12370 [Streptomyces mexicanus]
MTPDPRSAIWTAALRPIPELAPVTTATFIVRASWLHEALKAPYENVTPQGNRAAVLTNRKILPISCPILLPSCPSGRWRCGRRGSVPTLL